MKRAIVMMVLVFVGPGCTPKANVEKPKSIVRMVMGQVMLTSRGADRPAAAGMELTDGDILVTGDSSFAVISRGADMLIRVEPESRLALAAISGSECSIRLDSGAVLSRLKKLEKDESYSVHTKTAVAAVRGTSFYTSATAEKTVVAVGDGKVEVRAVNGTVQTADGGKAVVVETVASDAVLRDNTRIEELILGKIATIGDGAETLSDEDEKRIIEEDARINAEIEKLLAKGLSLGDIRKQYGRIDTVLLYTGKIYRGAIVSRGRYYRVVTPDGVVSIDARKVKKTDTTTN
jgi:hypothetical protein